MESETPSNLYIEYIGVLGKLDENVAIFSVGTSDNLLFMERKQWEGLNRPGSVRFRVEPSL